MHQPDIDRLRRFALGTGLALLAWAISDVEVSDQIILSYGVTVNDPELLAVAPALVSFYGLTRYWYYAVMIGTSPYHRRRRVLESLWQIEDGRITDHRPSILWRTSDAISDPIEQERKAGGATDRIVQDISGAFPRVLGKGPLAWADGTKPMNWYVRATIPQRSKIAALLQDLDYLLPALLNVVALIMLCVMA